MNQHFEHSRPSRNAAPSPMLVFGGPYSNLRATLAMRAEAERLGVPASRVICTGDVVAYCAEPEETVRAIRDWGCQTVQGNCEEQLAEAAGDCGCGFEEGSACDLLAKGWYPFANARVSAESRSWMAGLPKHLRFEMTGVRFLVVHGGVSQVNRFVFGSQSDVLDEEMSLADADVVIGGHAGVPFIARTRRGVWFNPGVIGMPANDGTTEVWYGLIEQSDDGAVRLATHRLSYDHRGAAAHLRKWGIADGYARALLTGLWPSLDVFPAAERALTGVRLEERELRLAPDFAAGT